MQYKSKQVSMSSLDGKKIAIVGGGPGGLTAARLLQQAVRELWCTSVITAAAHACKVAH
jgi:NADPH-dependent glutamate synthase beta subunit-like oxidoreductase